MTKKARQEFSVEFKRESVRLLEQGDKKMVSEHNDTYLRLSGFMKMNLTP